MVKQITVTANKISYEFKKQLKSPNLKSQSKFVSYEALIRSTFACGSECWSFLKNNGDMFLIFERNY